MLPRRLERVLDWGMEKGLKATLLLEKHYQGEKGKERRQGRMTANESNVCSDSNLTEKKP